MITFLLLGSSTKLIVLFINYHYANFQTALLTTTTTTYYYFNYIFNNTKEEEKKKKKKKEVFVCGVLCLLKNNNS